MHRALLMWDIDGTLLSGTSGRRAVRRTCQQLFGIPAADEGIQFAGRNDRQIFSEIMAAHGVHGFTLDQVLQTFLAVFPEELAKDPGQLYPGVSDLIPVLSASGAFAMALGTGNLEQNARLKLEAHGLNNYFPVGGFADDSEVRAEIIRRGIERAEAFWRQRFDRVIVIGDTPADIECGQANGARTLGVAQLRYSAAELAACGADAVLPSLADVPAAVAAISRLAG